MHFGKALQELEKKVQLPLYHPLLAREEETIYRAAYSFYHKSLYQKAEDLFTYLALHDPFCAKYWEGVASCRQMEGRFQEALQGWAIVCLLKNHEPSAHFHAAQCYLSLDNPEDAKKALSCAKKHLTKEHSHFLIIENLRNQLENVPTTNC